MLLRNLTQLGRLVYWVRASHDVEQTYDNIKLRNLFPIPSGENYLYLLHIIFLKFYVILEISLLISNIADQLRGP